MLRPKDTATWERKPLGGLWRFAPDADGAARREGWWERPLPGNQEVPVPASYNDIFPDEKVRNHVGDVWYQTTVRVPRGWAGERIVVRFGSATHRAVVWVDGTRVAEHEGGFTPFEADVSDVVEPGAESRITVLVNNVLTWQSIPPGYVDETPDGPRQRLLFDFFNYAGLHRSVWLYTTPRAHVRDVTVVTGLSGSMGTVRYDVETEDAGGLEVRVALRDSGSSEVARATGEAGELTVENAHLWRPGEGYLYDLAVELWDDDGDGPVDAYSLAVGIRTVEVDGARFLINGDPFYFKGFGKHEDAAVRGRGHDVFMVHDFALMEWLGANSFRTSHYPYAEEVLEHADRHGIVVIDEVAAVGINSGLAAGVFGAEPFETFSEETINADTQAAHRRAIRELVARNKNHACVVLWSIANVSGASPDLDVITDLFDVVMLNRYYGWYVATGDLPAAERALEAELEAWANTHGKPIIITEYSADTLEGLHDVFPGPWTEDYQAVLLEMNHRVFDRIGAVVGAR